MRNVFNLLFAFCVGIIPLVLISFLIEFHDTPKNKVVIRKVVKERNLLRECYMIASNELSNLRETFCLENNKESDCSLTPEQVDMANVRYSEDKIECDNNNSISYNE